MIDRRCHKMRSTKDPDSIIKANWTLVEAQSLLKLTSLFF